MVFNKYLDGEELEELFENYNISYLKSIDPILFEKNYRLLIELGFDFMDDLILKYLPLFTIKTEILNQRLLILKETLGQSYLDIISNDLTILEVIMK